MFWGVCGEWGRLVSRGRVGVGVGFMVSFYGYVEELKFEESCEEWAIVF